MTTPRGSTPETDDQIEGLLDALKKHIDVVLASIAAAENETHEELQARIADAAATTESATAELERKANEGSAAAKSHWEAFRATVQVKKDEVAARIDERARERDIRRALRAADDAEQFAVDSVRIAQIAIQNAWVSVLDAVDARLYAQDLAEQSDPSTTD